MTITIDAQLFIKYDDNGREIRALSGVSRRHAAAVDECDKTAQRLASAKQYLGKAAQDEAKLRKHIEQGKRPPIYSHTLLQPQTWFKGGVKSRLASREQALALTEQKEQACRKKEEELKARMPLLKKAERTLDADEQRRDAFVLYVTSFFSEYHTIAAFAYPGYRRFCGFWVRRHDGSSHTGRGFRYRAPGGYPGAIRARH